MFTRLRWFITGFAATLLVFLLINIVVAHLRSDCGIWAVIGLWLPRWSPCNDDIVRVGFPFLVLEQGGFAYRSIFDPLAVLLNSAIAVGASLLVGGVLLIFFSSGRRTK